MSTQFCLKILELSATRPMCNCVYISSRVAVIFNTATDANWLQIYEQVFINKPHTPAAQTINVQLSKYFTTKYARTITLP